MLTKLIKHFKNIHNLAITKTVLQVPDYMVIHSILNDLHRMDQCRF